YVNVIYNILNIINNLCILIIVIYPIIFFIFFFFNDTPTTEIYTLSLHDALPISTFSALMTTTKSPASRCGVKTGLFFPRRINKRSEEHTSELQSLAYLVCRLLLEKKKKNKNKVLVLYNNIYINRSLYINSYLYHT